MKLHYKIYFLLLSTVFFSACGGGSSSSGLPEENFNSAYLIDAPVKGITYTTNSTHDVTDSSGKFLYKDSDTSVTFTLGGVVLGKYDLANLNSDKQLFIGELLGSARDDTANTQVVLLLQLLQSLDSDNNPLNGITIDSSVALALANVSYDLQDTTISESDIETLLNGIGKSLLSKEMAVTYYEIYLNSTGNYNANTYPPIMLSSATYSVNENIVASFIPEFLDAMSLTYSLGGTDAGEFSIDSSTGRIAFKAAPDYETKQIYSIDLTATDSEGQTTTKTVTININDVIEAQTTFIPTLVVVMNWNDYSENDASVWEDKFFNENVNSVNRWLQETMHGSVAITPVGETSGTENDGIIMVDMGKNHPGGADDETFRDTEIKNAITSAEVVNNVDFAALDLDDNGILNTKELQIIYIVAGGERSFGDDIDHSIWAHQWSFGSTSGPEVDGVRVMQYSSDPIEAGTYARFGANHDDHKATIGVIVHEMGHSMLDLGDYYDDGGGSGLGWYDVMSGGSWAYQNSDKYSGETPTQYSVYNRIDTGFDMNVTEVTSTQTVTIECSSNNLVKLVTSKANEYFLLECRDTGKANSDIALSTPDQNFPEDKLFTMLYHVDTNKDFNREDGDQTDANHYKVALVEKETATLMTSSTNIFTDFDDVYLVGDTIASSRTNLYDGTATGFSLEVTAEDTTNRTMTIKITKD